MFPSAGGDPRVASALDERFGRSLAPTLLALCLMYAWQVASHPFLLGAGPGHVLWNVPLCLLVLCASGATWSWRRPLSRAQATTAFTVITTLASANVMLHVVVTGQLRRTAGLILTLLAIGFLVLSTRLFLALAAVVIAMWTVATRAAGLASDWAAWSFYLSIQVQSLAVALAVHIVRRGDLIEVETRRAALEEELARTEALLAALPDAVARIDHEGRVLALHADTGLPGLGPSGSDAGMNPAPVPWGLRRERSDSAPNPPVGRRLHELDLPNGADGAALAALARAFTNEGVQAFEYAVEGPTGPREFEARVRRAGADEAVLVVREVTAERRARRAREELLALVAHELRSPLTGIRGSFAMLEEAPELGPAQRKLIALGARSSERMTRLVNDLVDLEMAEAGQLRVERLPVDVAEVAHHAAEAYQPAAAERAVTIRVAAATRAPVIGDRDRLLQVLTNLLANASRVSPEGGEVELRVGPGPTEVRVEVADRGPGVPPELQGRLFQRFARGAEPRPSGSGLGLAISRTLVEVMGGQIGHVARAGGGAVFWITLPTGATPPPPTIET